MSTKAAVAIKGSRAGLQIILDDAPPFTEVVDQLSARLNETAAFFKGAHVILDVGERALDAPDWNQLANILASYGLHLTAVVAHSETSRASAQDTGLSLARVDQSRMPQPTEEAAEGEIPLEGILIRRTLRSGQVVRHPGHVVIIGDVNPGAEVIAGGDVVVWGSLRGIVHAGAMGAEDALVCALHLAPTQLRLAGYIARSPAESQRTFFTPEVAHIQGGRIVVEEWPSPRRAIRINIRLAFALALVFSTEAIAIALVSRYAPPSLYSYLTVLAVVAAVVLGWIVALAVTSRHAP